ncbi:MarR family winged helix-turn-helix transcriptional regulator [Pedomonas sp. V897]|uniref:MarR family winged helix-turn-helix transcriptional regulator n=1 Tax=Pedomonas sp. V897 TaxID=3446482 RepID=UPI003EE355FE
MPFRLSVLSNRVSSAVARLYEDRFDLKLPEWRIMAIVGRNPNLTASQIVDISRMDKVAVSRAVKRLVEMGRLTATSDPDDARRQRLNLSEAGWEIYAQIVPLALGVEERLLADMDEAERAVVDRVITRLTEAAAKLD